MLSLHLRSPVDRFDTRKECHIGHVLMLFKLKSGAQKTETSVEEQSRAGIIADFGKQ